MHDPVPVPPTGFGRTLRSLLHRAALNPEVRERLRTHPLETLRNAGIADAHARRLMTLAPVAVPAATPARRSIPARATDPGLR